MAAQWYVIHVYSGFEKKVAQLDQGAGRAEGHGRPDRRGPGADREVVEVRKGNKKVNAERKFFPGYVLVKMEMTDESWHLVKNTPKVTGFLGGRGRPMPITRERGRSHPEAGQGRHRAAEARRSPSRSASRCASPTARSPRSTAWSRKSTRRRRGSRCRCRSSAGRRRSSSNTRRSRRSDRDSAGRGRGRGRRSECNARR